MALGGQVVEQAAKAKEALLASVIANRRAQFTKPAKPTQHVRIAAELGKSADLRERRPQIADEVAAHIVILDDRKGLQGQREILHLRLENLFESPSRLTHIFGGEGRGERLATARAYSRQTSVGASWTYSRVV
jgi:hypothetical protein